MSLSGELNRQLPIHSMHIIICKCAIFLFSALALPLAVTNNKTSTPHSLTHQYPSTIILSLIINIIIIMQENHHHHYHLIAFPSSAIPISTLCLISCHLDTATHSAGSLYPVVPFHISSNVRDITHRLTKAYPKALSTPTRIVVVPYHTTLPFSHVIRREASVQWRRHTPKST